jgi:hypothetical protein
MRIVKDGRTWRGRIDLSFVSFATKDSGKIDPFVLH